MALYQRATGYSYDEVKTALVPGGIDKDGNALPDRCKPSSTCVPWYCTSMTMAGRPCSATIRSTSRSAMTLLRL